MVILGVAPKYQTRSFKNIRKKESLVVDDKGDKTVLLVGCVYSLSFIHIYLCLIYHPLFFEPPFFDLNITNLAICIVNFPRAGGCSPFHYSFVESFAIICQQIKGQKNGGKEKRCHLFI